MIPNILETSEKPAARTDDVMATVVGVGAEVLKGVEARPAEAAVGLHGRRHDDMRGVDEQCAWCWSLKRRKSRCAR